MTTSNDFTPVGQDSDWVSEACTLPTVEQPIRVAEFDDLFASAVRSVQQVSPTRARLLIDADARGRARDLAARETACCAFFGFTFSEQGDQVAMQVTVPPAHASVLAAWTARAASVAGLEQG